MTELTKEWLLRTIAELEEERDSMLGVVNEDAAMALAAMKLALASLEAEAVAWLLSGGGAKNNVSFDSGNAYADPLREVTPLYTAPPAPVSMKDHQIRELVNELRDIAVEYYGTQQLRERIAKTVRAAMLQGADGYSPDGWVACSERMPETMVSVLVTGTWFHHAVAFWDGLSWCDLDFEPPVTHWMPLPAAPQQEVTQALAKGMERYGDAMQKLADSGD